MSEDEYITVLWRVIGAMAVIIAALVGVVWRHLLIDLKRAADLDKCKDVLGIKDE